MTNSFFFVVLNKEPILKQKNARMVSRPTSLGIKYRSLSKFKGLKFASSQKITGVRNHKIEVAIINRSFELVEKGMKNLFKGKSRKVKGTKIRLIPNPA